MEQGYTMIDEQQTIYFEALSANRAGGAKTLEGFALRGVKNSVVEKYSDQAHFICELLQNADDAKAHRLVLSCSRSFRGSTNFAECAMISDAERRLAFPRMKEDVLIHQSRRFVSQQAKFLCVSKTPSVPSNRDRR